MKTFLNNVRWRTIGIITAIMAATALGCSWTAPRLQHNAGVHQHYESYQIYPQHQYYTAGTLQDPRAILALKPGYTLDSKDWQPVRMTPAKLEQWIIAMKQDPFVEDNQLPDGANLIDQNGEVAGHYYSVWEYPIVRIPAEKTIAMRAPMTELRMTNRFQMEMFYNSEFGGH